LYNLCRISNVKGYAYVPEAGVRSQTLMIDSQHVAISN
jgi:hypothetical protein